VVVHPGYRVNPTQVIVNRLHIFNVLGSDDRSLPRAIVGNDSVQVNDTIPDDDA
jgi:hypothetical protein